MSSSSEPTPESASEPRWRRLPGERPQQIIQAALEVFDVQGLAKARLDDIAKRAGVSKGTIYLYFPNKEELFREVVRETCSHGLNALFETEFEGTPEQQLMQYIERFLQISRHPGFVTIYRIIMGEIHLFPDLAKFYFDEVIAPSRRRVEHIIQRGIDAGAFRPLDTSVAARMLSALTITSAVWCTKRQFFPHMQYKTDAEVRAELIDFYLHAIRAPRDTQHEIQHGSHDE